MRNYMKILTMRLGKKMGGVALLIFLFSQSLNLFAQNWAKKAANAVFTLKTFDAGNQLIAR